jgi:hypothetical protein
MAGGWGNEWYFGYDHAHSDLTLNDFRSRDAWWDYTRFALDFFTDHDIPYWRMVNDNAISSAANDYGFVEDGQVYVVYLKDGGQTELDLRGVSGDFEVRWFDPRHGGALQAGSVLEVAGGDWIALGEPPNSPTSDWAILVRRADQPRVLFVRGADRSGGFLEANDDAGRTEQLADITNASTAPGNHGWAQLAEALADAGYALAQVTEEIEDGAPATGQVEGQHLDLEQMALGQYDVRRPSRPCWRTSGPVARSCSSRMRTSVRTGRTPPIPISSFSGPWVSRSTRTAAPTWWAMRRGRSASPITRSSPASTVSWEKVSRPSMCVRQSMAWRWPCLPAPKARPA